MSQSASSAVSTTTTRTLVGRGLSGSAGRIDPFLGEGALTIDACLRDVLEQNLYVGLAPLVATAKSG